MEWSGGEPTEWFDTFLKIAGCAILVAVGVLIWSVT
jgi:hypothetical protein